MRFDNIYERISFLICLLCDTRDDPGVRDFTIESVSKSFDIPIQVIRDDIAFLLGTTVLNDFSFDTLTEEPFELEKFRSEIKKGKYDDIRIEINRNPFDNHSKDFFIPVSKNEMSIIDKLINEKQPLFITKEMPPKVGADMERKIRIINEAIRNNMVIRFSYRKKKSIESNLLMRPDKIRINAKDPQNAVCIASNGVIWKIKQMNNIAEDHTNPAYQDPERPDLKDDWTAIWGLPSDKDTIEGTTQHVILEIEANTANIIEKIKADVERRKNGSLREIGPAKYIYEDDISGFNDFRVWLWGYGSSIKVIEPAWLAERIQSDFDIIRQQYESGEFIYE